MHMSQVGENGGVDASNLPRQLAVWEYEYFPHRTQRLHLAIRWKEFQCLHRHNSTTMCSTARFATSSKLKGILATAQLQQIYYKHMPATVRISSLYLHRVCLLLSHQSTLTTLAQACHRHKVSSTHLSTSRLISRHQPLCCKIFASATLSSWLILHARRFRCSNTKGRQSSSCRECVAAGPSGWL